MQNTDKQYIDMQQSRCGVIFVVKVPLASSLFSVPFSIGEMRASLSVKVFKSSAENLGNAKNFDFYHPDPRPTVRNGMVNASNSKIIWLHSDVLTKRGMQPPNMSFCSECT